MATLDGCECCSTPDDTQAATEAHVCYCPVDDVIDTIGKKHALQIVAILGARGPTRYSELSDALGATSSSLVAKRLEELTEADLVERRSFDEVPPRVEYSLTAHGRELERRLQPLLDWAAESP